MISGEMKRKAIFYVPVEEKYLHKWEYYSVDLEILKSLYSEVVICSTIFSFLSSFKNSDLVFCWWWHRSVPVVVISKFLGIKTAVTGAVHMYDVSGATDYFNKTLFYRLACQICFRIADLNLFISKDQFLQVTSHLKVNNSNVVYSSLLKGVKPRIVLKKLNLHTRKKTLNKKKQVKFLTVIWHTEDQYKRKGLFETMEALSLIKKDLGDCFLWTIAGMSGPGLSVLKSKIKKFGLSKMVELKMDVSAKNKEELYELNDLYLQPSWFEGFGNAVLEAMSYGLPALVSKYTAQPEVVGSSGLVVFEISPRHIYKKLSYFIKLSENDKREMAKNATKRVIDKFTFERRLKDIHKLLLTKDFCN